MTLSEGASAVVQIDFGQLMLIFIGWGLFMAGTGALLGWLFTERHVVAGEQRGPEPAPEQPDPDEVSQTKELPKPPLRDPRTWEEKTTANVVRKHIPDPVTLTSFTAGRARL